MSLLQSIFGGESESKKKVESHLDALFEKKVEADDASDGKSSSDSDDSSSSSSSKGNEKSENEEETKKEETSPPKKQRKNKKEPAQSEPTTEEPNNSSANEKEDRTIFVGNLPLSTTRRSLSKLFSEVGKVESARIRSAAVTGVKIPQERAGNQRLVKKVSTNTRQLDKDAKSSLHGYVVFVDAASVPKAVQQLNNKPLPDEATGASRRIRVDTASPTLDPKRSVFVGNLPYQADEDTLREHFVRGCGLKPDNVQGVRLIRDKETFQCKGFGYVLLEDSNMVALALQKMHDSTYMRRPLRVKVCGKSVKGRRGQKKPQKDSEKQEQRGEAAGALRRVVGNKKSKRVRGEKKKGKPGLKPSISKRAAASAKAGKRTKKIEKRISKGMGKTKKIIDSASNYGKLQRILTQPRRRKTQEQFTRCSSIVGFV